MSKPAGDPYSEQIVITRKVLCSQEQCGTSFYVCFVDYQKALNNGHMETLWMIMESVRIPLKLIKMIKAMYDGNQCSVPYGTSLTGRFLLKSGE